MTPTDQPPTTIQDPAALRQIRDLEPVIEARLEASRQSRDRVEAARIEAAVMLDSAAADEAAAQESHAILDSARREAAAHEANHQERCTHLTARAVQLRADLAEAVLAAVLPDPGHSIEAQR